MFKYPVWNCTGHDINVLNRDGVVQTIPSRGLIRLEETVIVSGTLPTEYGEIALGEKKFGRVVGIPEGLEEAELSVVIVSLVVLQQIKDDGGIEFDSPLRHHMVVAPDTGASAVRDEKGRIQYVVQFLM